MTHQQKDTDLGSGIGNVGTSLLESICSPGVADIAAIIGDSMLDLVLDNGILEKIPVIGLLVKGYGLVMTVRDRLFLKKVAMFLHETKNITESEKNQFGKKLASNPSFCRKVGENLVLLLDRQENFDKASILGKVFTGYIRGDIQYDLFLKLAAAIDRTFIEDLKNLETYYSRIDSYDSKQGRPFFEYLDDATCQSLYNVGLVRSESYTEITYHPNELGSHFISLLKQEKCN